MSGIFYALLNEFAEVIHIASVPNELKIGLKLNILYIVAKIFKAAEK